jgi:putative DNA primase/helicase
MVIGRLSDAPAALIALIVKHPAPPRELPNRERRAGREHGEAVRKYALAALDNQTKAVESAGTGTRNHALNNAALALGHLVGAGALTEHVVRAALEGACHANCLAKDDGVAAVRTTISSGLKAGIAQPTDLSKIGQRARPRRAPAPASDREAPGRQTSQRHQSGNNDADPAGELNRRLASFKLTDVGNVERFLARYGERFRWM